MKIHEMTIRERYRFYRRWHGRITAGQLAIPFQVVLLTGAIIGLAFGLFW